MRTTLSIIAMIVVVTGSLPAQESQQPESPSGAAAVQQKPRRHQGTYQSGTRARAEAAKKDQQVPSIIQAELDRSRAEEKQVKPVPVQPVQLPAPQAPLWPLFVSLGIGAVATGSVLYFFLLRKTRSRVSPQRPATTTVQPAPAPAPSQPPAIVSVYEPPASFADEKFDEQDVQSASPYVNDEESEMPEAALTMNLLNKKRETKKELILEVMKRVQRKENPQHIAEALRIGIGEVHLAMTLAKLKK